MGERAVDDLRREQASRRPADRARPGTTQTLDATALALDWFEAHPLDNGRAALPTATTATSDSISTG